MVSTSASLSRSLSGMPTIRVGGRVVKLQPMTFAWSSSLEDNWAGTNTTFPDGSYQAMGDNGLIVAEDGVPGTIPLQVFSRKYDIQHTDWATLASPAGLAWAQANGYTFQYTAVSFLCFAYCLL